MWLLRAVAITVVFLVLTACGHQAGSAGKDVGVPRLQGTYVVTAATDSGRPHSLVPGSRIEIRFGDRIVVTAGCNTMTGTYRIDGTRLVVQGLAMTEMGCAQPLMVQDAWVASLLDHPVQLVTGTNARLVSGNVVLALSEGRAVSPERPLVGTKWLLDTVYNGQTASSVPLGDVAWVVFDHNGNVSVNDGLNDGSGLVRVAGNQLTFGDLAWSLVGCVGHGCPVGNFSKVLSGTATFAITGGSLTITQGVDGLGFKAVDRLPPRH